MKRERFLLLWLVLFWLFVAVGIWLTFSLSQNLRAEKLIKDRLPPVLKEKSVLQKSLVSQKKIRLFEFPILDDRVLRLFVGPQLYVRKDDGKIVDIYQNESVHDGIPNDWFLKYGIDITLLDAPLKDADKDGFSNREEYFLGTNPKDFSSHPPLISRLKIAHIDVVRWKLIFSGDIGDKYQFRYRDSLGKENQTSSFIVAGETFFTEGEEKNRFRLVKVLEEKIFNKSLNADTMKKIAYVEDQSSFKKGFQYQVSKGREGEEFQDSKVVFYIDALGMQKDFFEIRENQVFTLPDETETKYLLRKIDNQQVEIEFRRNGEQKVLILPVKSS